MSTLNVFRQLRRIQTTPFYPVDSSHPLSWYHREEKRHFYRLSKRVIDITASITALVLLLPLMLIVGLLIKLDSKGPIFYSQERVGKKGRTFRFWKFRSMTADSDKMQVLLDSESDSNDLRFKMTEDPRITGIGKFIRKYSIDELPQLWNVLKGDMALVGPRPPLPREVDQYSVYHLRRLAVTPGITCTWQIGGRANIPFEQQIEMDLEYIRNRSLLEDLRILFLTPYAVVSGNGAC